MSDEPFRPSFRSEAELDARADSVARAREAARAFLRDHGYRDGDQFDALLVISELAANAVKHGSQGLDQIRMRLELVGRTLRVAVSDAGRGGAPTAFSPDHEREHSRGLYLVNQLSTSWHARIRNGRREVTAEIPLH